MTMMQEQLSASRDTNFNNTVDQYHIPQATNHVQHSNQRQQHHMSKQAAVRDAKQVSISVPDTTAGPQEIAGSTDRFEPPFNHDRNQQVDQLNAHDQQSFTAAGASPDISSRVRQIADSLDTALPPDRLADLAVTHASPNSQDKFNLSSRVLQARLSQEAGATVGSNSYSMHQGFWEDKKKLVPNLSACIEEVKLLRASLSNTSALSQE